MLHIHICFFVKVASVVKYDYIFIDIYRNDHNFIILLEGIDDAAYSNCHC